MKLLYIMGIDWEWIFQRPQIIAMHLIEKYDTTVIFPKSILRRQTKSKRQKYPPNYRILWTLPLQEKNGLIRLISMLWNRKLFSDVCAYDVIVIGYPLYYRYIPPNYAGKIIYDCMDNHESLYPDRNGLKHLMEQERALAVRSNAIIATSEKLYQKMETLATGKVRLIRNGTDMDIHPVFHAATSDSTANKKENFTIGYFGTLAEWFDYTLLKESLQVFPDIEYRLIGPVMQAPLFASDRIRLEGILPHDQLAKAVEDCDCLIMPFIVNDVVEWVDPVKLYEYVALGKCIICVRYQEVTRFNEYVYLYETHEEYMSLLASLKQKFFPVKYTEIQQKKFLEQNSWQERFHKWDMLLDEVLQAPEK